MSDSYPLNLTIAEPAPWASYKQFASGLSKSWGSSAKVVRPQFEGNKAWTMASTSGHHVAKYLEKNHLDLDWDALMLTSSTNAGPFYLAADGWIKDNCVVHYVHDTDIDFDDPNLAFFLMTIPQFAIGNHAFFNSRNHRNEYIRFLHQWGSDELIDLVETKSSVLHCGMDLQRFDTIPDVEKAGIPKICWNLRAGTDKRPAVFLDILIQLQELGLEFELYFTGVEVMKKKLRERFNKLGSAVRFAGYAQTWEEYAKILKGCDFSVSTAIHETFGISVNEAMYCGMPVLMPNKYAYTDYAPQSFLYDTEEQLVERMVEWITDIDTVRGRSQEAKRVASQFDWSIQGPKFQKGIQKVVDSHNDHLNLNSTGKVTEVVKTLTGKAMTKREIYNILGWGSPEWWYKYRAKMLANGVNVSRKLDPEPIFYTNDEDLRKREESLTGMEKWFG